MSPDSAIQPHAGLGHLGGGGGPLYHSKPHVTTRHFPPRSAVSKQSNQRGKPGGGWGADNSIVVLCPQRQNGALLPLPGRGAGAFRSPRPWIGRSPSSLEADVPPRHSRSGSPGIEGDAEGRQALEGLCQGFRGDPVRSTLNS